MVDIGKKIAKHRQDDLEPGETVIAGTVAQPQGSFRRQAAFGAFGAIGALIGGAITSRRNRTLSDSPGEGMAARVPAGRNLLGLTEQRLLIFGQGSITGRPTVLHAAFPLDQIASITQDVGRFSGMMAVNFVDETSVQFEALKGAKPGPFVDAFDAATGR